MLTVTPSIGKTQGVKLRSSPPANSARNQPIPPPASADSSRLRVAGDDIAPGVTRTAWVPVAGDVSACAALELEPGGCAAPVTVTATENGTEAGARQS